MKKRLKAIKEGRITTEQEVIDLDIVEYVNASSRMMQKFFTEEFIESYKYLLRSFLFRPRNEVKPLFYQSQRILKCEYYNSFF